MNNTVLRATKAMDRESTQTRKERVAVVVTELSEVTSVDCSLRKTLRDTSESKLKAVDGQRGTVLFKLKV